MFRVFREHRFGGLRACITDCMDAIEHQRHGDASTCTYRIEYVERDGHAGYQVWRKHRVGDDNVVDWIGAHKRINESSRIDTKDSAGRSLCNYSVEVV